MKDINSDLVRQIFQRYKGLMFKIAFDVLDDKEDAEDALQSTAEKIFAKPELFTDLESEKTKRLLITITRNTAIDFYRKRDNTQKREVSFDDVIDMPSIEMTIPYENDAYIALGELPESYRDILRLKYSCGYTMTEIADILDITEPNARKRVSRARKHLEKVLKKGCILMLCVLALALTGMAVNAATGGRFFASIKEFFGAEVVTDENRDMISKRTEFDTFVFDNEDVEIPESEHLSNSKIIHSVKDKERPPVSISDIKTEHGIMPEIIININACAVLYQEEYAGWYCEQGDTLCFDFSKYELETKESQSLTVGYVLDDVMYEGMDFDNLNGCYQLKVKEDGEYYIYLVNMDMDYISMESGTVFIIPH